MNGNRRQRAHSENSLAYMTPSSTLLSKIRRDLKKDGNLLVMVAATKLSSRVPHLASELQQARSVTRPTEDLHPTQMGRRQKRPEYREIEPSNPVLRYELSETYQSSDNHGYAFSLSTIQESCEE